MKLHQILAVGFVALSFVGVARAADRDPDPPKELRIAYLRSPDALSLAKIKGSLAGALGEQGTSIVWAGPFAAFAPAVEAINAGRVDVTTGSSTAAVSALAGKSPIVIFAYKLSAPDAEGVLVKKDGPIRSITDLVGKTAAVNRGGTGEYLLVKALERYGVPTDKVNRAYLGPDDASAAFAAGKVDAWAVWDPFLSIATVQSEGKLLLNGTAIGDENATVMVASTDFLQRHRATLKIVYDVLHDEGDWALAHPQEAAQLWAKEIGLAPEVAQQIAAHSLRTFGPADATAAAQVQHVAQWFYDQKIIPSLPDASAFLVDLSK